MSEPILPFMFDITLKLLLALICGGVIGFQRQLSERPAGFRTHILVSVGSAVYMLVSVAVAGDNFDPGRIAAQVASGIGFLGAGTIIKQGSIVRGLTTAASLWAAAGIGLAAGYGGRAMIIAVIATLIVMLALTFLQRIERYIARLSDHFAIRITLLNPRERITWLRDLVRSRNITIAHLAITSENKGLEEIFLEGIAPDAQITEELIKTLLKDKDVTDIKHDEEGSW